MRKKKLFIEKLAVFAGGIFLLIALLLISGMVDPVITFEDDGLESAIRDKLGKEYENIHKSDLLTITELDASGRSIRNLNGIERLRQLVVLNLEDNFVQDLSPLSELNRLTELSLRNNEITELAAVSFDEITDLPLRKLSLRHNVYRLEKGSQIRLADISLLSKCLKLVELELRDNHIEDITPLMDLTNLKILDLRENRINDIAATSELTALEKLNLRRNNLIDLDPLVGLTQLKYLNIHSNENIKSIEALANLVNLETLIMRNVPVGEQIDVLDNMTALSRLNIRNCEIKDAAVIGNLMAKGALQNDEDKGIKAEIDLRDNMTTEKGFDPFASIRKQWRNVEKRSPYFLPGKIKEIEAPAIYPDPGFYEKEIQLELIHPDENVELLYTIDGSLPRYEDESGGFEVMQEYPDGELITWKTETNRYESELVFDADNIPDNDYEQINTTRSSEYLSIDRDINRAIIIRAAAYCKERGMSEVSSASYFLSDRSEYNLPVISIITEPKDLFDYNYGIYIAGVEFDNYWLENLDDTPHWSWPANFMKRGIESERKSYLELYDPGENSPELKQDVGIRIHGNSSRSHPLKSLRIYSRPEYGTSYMSHAIFSETLLKGGELKDSYQYSRLILRNSGQDGSDTLIRDALSQMVVKHYPGVEYQAYRPAIHFINGVYWGIINIRERHDQYYFKEHYDIKPEDLVVIANEEVQRGKIEDIYDYEYLERIVELYNPEDKIFVDRLAELLDLESLTYYNIGNLYLTHSYWPITGTYDNVCWRKRVDNSVNEARFGHDGRWRWMWKDMDKSFVEYNWNMYAQLERHESVHKTITKALWSNEDYLHYFLNTLADEINTTFNRKRLISKINKIHSAINDEQERHYKRWSKGSDGPSLFIKFAKKRPAIFLEQTINYFGLKGLVEITLITDPDKGATRINSLEICEDTIGIDDPTSWSGIYFQNVPVKITAVPKPGYEFKRWKEVDDREDELVLTLTRDLTLTAIFEENN